MYHFQVPIHGTGREAAFWAEEDPSIPESSPHDAALAYRTRAIARVRDAVAALELLGVSVVVTGSLARGRVAPGSDVDLLVTSCPRELKYAIEGIVEDCLDGLAFDVVYRDEIPSWKLPGFMEGAVDVADLR